MFSVVPANRLERHNNFARPSRLADIYQMMVGRMIVYAVLLEVIKHPKAQR